MEEKIKLCVGCKHHVPPIDINTYNMMAVYGRDVPLGYLVDQCKHPSIVEIDPVRGTKILAKCNLSRTRNGHCGPTGANWEPKTPE